MSIQEDLYNDLKQRIIANVGMDYNQIVDMLQKFSEVELEVIAYEAGKLATQKKVKRFETESYNKVYKQVEKPNDPTYQSQS